MNLQTRGPDRRCSDLLGSLSWAKFISTDNSGEEHKVKVNDLLRFWNDIRVGEGLNLGLALVAETVESLFVELIIEIRGEISG